MSSPISIGGRKLKKASEKVPIRFTYSDYNCGLEIGCFYTKKFPEDVNLKWSYKLLAQSLNRGYLREIVVFSGAHYQKAYRISPYTFAKWLKEQEEQVSCSKVLTRRNGSEITVFVWQPSQQFQDKFNKAWAELEQEKYARKQDSQCGNQV